MPILRSRRLRLSVAFLLVVALVAVTLRLTVLRPEDHTTDDPVMVGPAGGTFTLSGITITVPPGAVATPAELEVTTPRLAGPQAQAPLGKHARGHVQFDVNLGGGKVQLRKPLPFALPLTEAFLPNGMKPQQALLYTEAQKRNGYELIPTRLDKSQVLHGEFRHLTLMDLVFVDIPKFLGDKADDLVVPGIGRSRPGDCKLEVSTADAGKVRIGSPLGWSMGRTSTIHPCLEAHNGALRLKIINNSFIYWQVGTKEGTTLTVERNETAALMITKIARMLGADPGTQEYLDRGGELLVDIPSKALPGRTALRAGYGTFHAEALWLAMNALVAITLGREIPPTLHYAADLIRTVFEPMLETIGIIDCLRTAFKLASGKGTTMEALITLFDFFTSTCAAKIAEAVVKLAGGGSGGTSAFWISHLGVLGVIKQAADTLLGGFTNAYQQTYPPVVVTVEGVEPVTTDLHEVDWGNVTVPGSWFGGPAEVKLTDGMAKGVHTTFDNEIQQLHAGTESVEYGDLDGDGKDEAALHVLVNPTGVAPSDRARAWVIFRGGPDGPEVVGVLTPRVHPVNAWDPVNESAPLPTFLESASITQGRVVVKESFYRSSEGSCCPSGRAITTWSYSGGKFVPGEPQITR